MHTLSPAFTSSPVVAQAASTADLPTKTDLLTTTDLYGQTAETSQHSSTLTVQLLDMQQPNLTADERKLLQQAQQLRTECFFSEFGVLFDNGLDADGLDEHCVHVLVRQGGQVVATARLLSSQRAGQLGCFYSDHEFYLQEFLSGYPYPIVEIGRTCIHLQHRGIRALLALWQGIAEVAKRVHANAFMGCCSLPLGAGDVNAWLAGLAKQDTLAIRPKHRLPPSVLSGSIEVPPLLSMYLRMGASVSQSACFDPDFHCADVFVWLPFEQMNARYHSLLH